MPGPPSCLAGRCERRLRWLTLPSPSIYTTVRGTARRVVRHRRGRFAYAIRARAPARRAAAPLRAFEHAAGRGVVRILVCRPVGCRCPPPERLRFVGYFVRAALQGGSTRCGIHSRREPPSHDAIPVGAQGRSIS